MVLPACPPSAVSILSHSSPEVFLWSLNLSILRCLTCFFLSFFSTSSLSGWRRSKVYFTVLGVHHKSLVCVAPSNHFHWATCASKLLHEVLNSDQLVGLPWYYQSLKRQDGTHTFKGIAQLSHKTPASPLIYPWVPQVIWLPLWRNVTVWHWHWNGPRAWFCKKKSPNVLFTVYRTQWWHCRYSIHFKVKKEMRSSEAYKDKPVRENEKANCHL